jgi:PAS domain S-box-containing protein
MIRPNSAKEQIIVTSLGDDLRHSINLSTEEIQGGFVLAAKMAPVMIWMTDCDNLCVYVNEGWVRFTGRPFGTQLGNGWMEVVHADDLESMKSTYLNACHQRVTFQINYQVRRFDGEYRWILDTGVPRFDENSSFAGYVGSCIDITDRKLAEEELKSLSGQLINAQEEERSRIARELHDDYQQRLAVLSIDLKNVAQSFGADSHAGSRLNELGNRVVQLAADLHLLSHRLHSATLDYLGIVAALEKLCAEFEDRHSIRVSFVAESVLPDLAEEVKLCLFRIAQEALRNVQKHSHADSAEVRVKAHEQRVHLSISDHGTGFDSGDFSKRKGIGIRSIEERLRLVGGNITLHSKPMEGTRIDVWVPIKAR